MADHLSKIALNLNGLVRCRSPLGEETVCLPSDAFSGNHACLLLPHKFLVRNCQLFGTTCFGYKCSRRMLNSMYAKNTVGSITIHIHNLTLRDDVSIWGKSLTNLLLSVIVVVAAGATFMWSKMNAIIHYEYAPFSISYNPLCVLPRKPNVHRDALIGAIDWFNVNESRLTLLQKCRLIVSVSWS